MAVITPPFVQQGGSHPAATFRQALAGLLGAPFGSFAGGVAPTTGGGAHGVAGPGYAVTQNGTPNMSVNVAGGHAFVRGTEAAAQGSYGAYNDGTTNLVVAAADPTNPRRDLVVIRVRDAFYSGGSTDVALAVVTGTPAASPTDPTPPANSLVLARITVAAAATTVVNANITDLRRRAAAVGAPIVCLSTARPTNPSVGTIIFEFDTFRERVWNGSAWALMNGDVRCRVRRANTAQTVNAGVGGHITWDIEDFDTDAFYPGSGTTLTIPFNGRWAIQALVSNLSGITTNNTNFRASLDISGYGVIPFPSQSFASTTGAHTIVSFLAAGTTVRLFYDNPSAGTVTMNAFMEINWIGPS